MKTKIIVMLFVFSQINWWLLVLGPYWLGIITTLLFCDFANSQNEEGLQIKDTFLPALIGFGMDYVFFRTGLMNILAKHDCSCYLLFIWINFCIVFPLARSFVCSWKFPVAMLFAPLVYLGAQKFGTVQYQSQEAIVYHALAWFVYGVIIRGLFIKRGYSNEPFAGVS